MPYCSNCGKAQARFKNNGSLCSPCLNDQMFSNNRSNLSTIDEAFNRSNNDSVSSNNSLIKIDVMFESPTIENNLLTPPSVFMDIHDVNVTSLNDIPEVSLDINDEIPIIINSDTSNQGINNEGSLDKAPLGYNRDEVHDNFSDSVPGILTPKYHSNNDIEAVYELIHGGDDNIVTDGIKDLKSILEGTINKLYETIDILKEEIKEKKLFRSINFEERH